MKNSAKRSLIEQTKTAALARHKAQYVSLVALIRRRMTEVVEGFYDIGQALREMLEKKVYAAEGHTSLQAFLAAEGLMSYAQASKLIAIARKVPRESAITLGQERAYALLAYTTATVGPDAPTVSADAIVDGKPATEASLREIEAATRAARAAKEAQRPQSEAERARDKAREAVAKAVKRALREAGLARVEVSVGRETVRVHFAREHAERLAKTS